MDNLADVNIIPLTPARLHGLFRRLSPELGVQRAAHRALTDHRIRCFAATVLYADRDQVREFVRDSQRQLWRDLLRLPHRAAGRRPRLVVYRTPITDHLTSKGEAQ